MDAPSTKPADPDAGRVWLGVIVGGAMGGGLVGCADALAALEGAGVPGGRLLLLPTALALAAVGAAAAAPWAAFLAHRAPGWRADALENRRWWGVGPGAAAAAWVSLSTGPLAGHAVATAVAAAALGCLGLAAVTLARTTRARIFTMAGLIAAVAVPVHLVARPRLGPPPATPARSVALITIEGWGARDGLGDAAAALAAQGVRFDAVVPPSPDPAVALRALHLGAAAWAPGGLDPGSSLPPADTLGQHFARAGWRTGAFVGHPEAAPRPRGFQRVDAQDAWLPGLSATAPARLWAALTGAGPTRRRASDVVARAHAWATAPEVADRPRFVWVHLSDGAFPWAPPPPWDTALYAGDPHDPAHRADGAAPLPADARARWPDVADPAWMRAQRAGALAAADAALPGLLDGLDGPWVVAVVGVGPTPRVTWGGPLAGAPALTDDTLRVPLVLRAPGLLPSGATVAAPVELTDLSATLLELAGAPGSSETGASLVPLAFGRRGPPFARVGLTGEGARIVSATAVWDPSSGPPPEPAWAGAADELAAALAPAP